MPFSLTGMFRPNNKAAAAGTTGNNPESSPLPSTTTLPTTSQSISSSTLSDSLALLTAFLQSPLWCVPLSSFIDVHCLYFDTSTEHPLTHTSIHNSYIQLCETLLTTHCETVGLTPTDFVTVCQHGLTQSADALTRQLIGEVLLLDEYELFHRRMVSRNIELDAQVLAECITQQTIHKNKEKQRMLQQQQSQHGGDEDEALRVAIQLSLLEEESARKEKEREAAEIDYAIQLSLALQAEELRMAEERQKDMEEQRKQQQERQRQTQHESAHREDKQQKVEKVEEEKESAPPTQSAQASIAAPLVSSPPQPSTSVALLAPVKNLRRTYEANVQKVEAAREERAATVDAAATQHTVAASVADEAAARQQYLRLQRERLIARNKEAGTKQLSAFNADLAATEQAVQKRQQEQQKQQINTKSASAKAPASSDDSKRAAMQAVLKARLRAEAEKTIASRTEQRSLDEQLHMLQNLSV